MNYLCIVLFGGFVVVVLLVGCFVFFGKLGGKDWICWICDSKVVIEWCYIDGSKNIVDLCLKDEDDVVYYLEQEFVVVGVFYSDGCLGFYLENDEGLVYWVEIDDFIGCGCKVC